MNCKSLESIVIPKSINSSDNSVFNSLPSLRNITIELDLKVQYISDYAFNSSGSYSNPPTLVIPPQIKTIYSHAFLKSNIKLNFSLSKLEAINQYAFKQNFKLSGVLVLPDTLITISNNAFAYCTNINEVVFTGNSLKSISAAAFYKCTNLQKINLPSSLHSFDPACFSGCFKLTNITGPSPNSGSNITVKENIVYNKDCSTLIACPPGLAEAFVVADTNIIGENAFYQCEILQNVQFNNPSKVSEISKNTFSGCVALERIILPASTHSIGDMSFKGCTALSSIDFSINTKIGTIGDSAFEGCVKLSSIQFYNAVNFTKIGDSAFKGCAGLSRIEFPRYLNSIGSSAFKGCGLTEVVLKAPTIGVEAFGNCVKLLKADVSHLNSIPNSLFAGCVNLSKVYFTSTKIIKSKSKLLNQTKQTQTRIMNIGSIGDSSFKNTGLVSITIPTGVTSLGQSAFADCINLKTVNISGTVSAIGDNCFGGCDKLQSIVYCGDSNVNNQCGFNGTVEVFVRDGFTSTFCGVSPSAILDMWCGFEVPTALFTGPGKNGFGGNALASIAVLANGGSQES